MSKTIGVCAIYRQHQYAGGAYSFTENLLRGLAELRRTLPAKDAFHLTVFVGSQGILWSDDQVTFQAHRDPLGRWPVETRVGLIDGRGFDGILFPNTFTPPFIRAQRAVTVIHDLNYLNLPEHWPLAKRVWMRACHEVTLRRCEAVVAISHWVKEDILKHYGRRWESRVHAIWNPISFERLSQPAEEKYSNGRPYILCAAVDRPAKNMSTLIRAFAIFQKRFPEYCLVLAGQLRRDVRGWRRRSARVESKLPSAADLVEALDLSKHVVLTGYVPDAQLGALYRGAALFVLPSLFEGFGMPAVEALAMGAPALVSDLPVMREVTLNGAHYIPDPLDQQQLADQIAEVLSLGDAARPTEAFRNEVRERFAPVTIARQYLKLLLGES